MDWFVNRKLEESGLENLRLLRPIIPSLVLWFNGITSIAKRGHEVEDFKISKKHFQYMPRK